MAREKIPEKHKEPVFYGRRHGRRLRPRARDNLEWGLARFGIDVEGGDDDRIENLFDNPAGNPAGNPDADLFLEIGFGGGEHLVARALAARGSNFIGAEPFVNGIAKLCTAIRDHDIRNIRIFPDDVRLLLPRLDESSLAGVFILFPDPWPKTRHAARRILSADMPARLARLLRPGGQVLLASDDAGAKSWLLKAMLSCSEFEWRAQTPRDWRAPPTGWPLDATRYMAKAGAEGRKPAWFLWERRP